MYSDDMNTRGLRVTGVVGVLFSILHLLQTEARVRDNKGAPSSIQERTFLYVIGNLPVCCSITLRIVGPKRRGFT